MFLKKLFIKKNIYGVLFFVLLFSLFFGGAKKVDAKVPNPSGTCCVSWVQAGKVEPIEKVKTTGVYHRCHLSTNKEYCNEIAHAGHRDRGECIKYILEGTTQNGINLLNQLDPERKILKELSEGGDFSFWSLVAFTPGGIMENVMGQGSKEEDRQEDVGKFCDKIINYTLYVEPNANCLKHEAICGIDKEVVEEVLGDLADCVKPDPIGCSEGRGDKYCFWSKKLNSCQSRLAMTKCQYYNEVDCNKVRPNICNWVPDTTSSNGGMCLDIYKQWLYKTYNLKKKDFGSFLPECAKLGACTNVNELVSVFVKFAKEVFKYVGALAFLFFIYGGGVMVLSFGNAEKFKKGRQILLAAVIGMVIVFSAYFVVGFLLELLGAGSVNIFT